MRHNWKETTLGEVAKVNDATIDKTYSFDEIEYIDIASIEERRILQTQKLKLEDAPSRAKRIVRDNDSLISTVRPNLKHYCFIKKASPNLIASTGFAVVTATKSDPAFIYYLLTTDDYTDYLTKIADSHTSTYPSFNPEVIENSRFSFPPLPEQKAIAAILSSFDDKIELLWRQNKTLEQISQTIFKEWFIKFTVKGEKLKVNSKTGLPEGWRMGKLPDAFEVSPDRKLKKGELAPYLDMKGMPTQGHRAEGWYKRQFTSGSKFISGDTLLARITPCLENGKTAFVDFLEEGQVGWGSTEFIVLRPKTPLPPFYGYLLARSNAFRSFAIGQMTGSSGRQRVPENSLSNYDAVIPSEAAAIRFGETISPIEQRLTLNGKQIQTLSKLRDALLPKLMKGEIRVGI